MVLQEKEIEVVVRDPEVESFRELEYEIGDRWFVMQMISIGPEGVRYEDREHDGLNKAIYVELRLREDELQFQQTSGTESVDK